MVLYERYPLYIEYRYRCEWIELYENARSHIRDTFNIGVFKKKKNKNRLNKATVPAVKSHIGFHVLSFYVRARNVSRTLKKKKKRALNRIRLVMSATDCFLQPNNSRY